MIFTQKKCPSCHQEISLIDIKRVFKCKTCDANLKSNGLLILILCGCVSAVVGTILGGVFGGYDWLFDILVFTAIFPPFSNRNLQISLTDK